MRKLTKIYLWAWVCVIAISVVASVVALHTTSHHDLARNPSYVERIVNVDLPDIVHTESSNNLDRGTSRWDVYTHSCQFASPLDTETIQRLDELCLTDRHWRKESYSGCYIYSDHGGFDELYNVCCNIYSDHLYIEYMVDESEGMFAFLPLIIVYVILYYLGWILGIIALVRYIFRRGKESKRQPTE